MMHIMKKILNITSTVLMIALGAIGVLLVSMRLFGMQGYTVLSGSMEPEFPTGSVIYVKKVNPDVLQAGDVITFRISGGTVVTHRITEVIGDNGTRRFRTKGDANEIADGSPVNAENVIGTPAFSVPYLGYALTYIQRPPGMYVAMAVAAWILLLIFLPSLIFEKGDNNRKTMKEENK